MMIDPLLYLILSCICLSILPVVLYLAEKRMASEPEPVHGERQVAHFPGYTVEYENGVLYIGRERRAA